MKTATVIYYILSISLQHSGVVCFTTRCPDSKKAIFGHGHSLISRGKASSTSLSVASQDKITTTDNLNQELYSLYHNVDRYGDISKVYEAEKLVFDSEKPPYPNTVSYNTVLSSWAKMASRLSEGTATVQSEYNPKGVYVAKDAAARAQKILEEMEITYLQFATEKQEKEKNEEEEEEEEAPKKRDPPRPSTTSYNVVIDAWAKSKVSDAPERAENLLKRMARLTSTTPLDLTPDVVTYNGVMTAYCNSKSTHSLEKAEELFERMIQSGIKPNVLSYNCLMNAYAKAIINFSEAVASSSNRKRSDYEELDALKERATKRTLDLLDELEGLYEETELEEYKPCAITYTTVIDCVARSGFPDAPQRAEALLEKLEERFAKTKDLSICPNVWTYTTVINAWSWSNQQDIAPQRAEALLKKMEDQCGLFSTTANSDENIVKPNVRTYTAVIHCWAHSKDKMKAQHSLKILKKMNDKFKETGDFSIKPNLYTYNAVIDACAKLGYVKDTKSCDDALKIAFAVFKALQKDKTENPNHVTYATLLKATKNLLPQGDSRNDIVRAVFAKCKQEGYVDDGVLRQLRQTVDSETFQELLGKEHFDSKTGSVQFSKLPVAWRRNSSKGY